MQSVVFPWHQAKDLALTRLQNPARKGNAERMASILRSKKASLLPGGWGSPTGISLVYPPQLQTRPAYLVQAIHLSRQLGELHLRRSDAREEALQLFVVLHKLVQCLHNCSSSS